LVAKVVALLLSVVGLTAGGQKTQGTDVASRHSPDHHFANCTHATARLAQGPGISLEVTCWAPHRGGDFGFAAVRLDPLDEYAPQGIRSFAHHPSITGPGATRRYGQCSWSRGSLGCRAESRGAVTIHGAIRVRAGTACDAVLSITTAVTTCEPTVKRPCPASLTVAELYNDLPRGC